MSKLKFLLLFVIAIGSFFLYITSKKSDWFSPRFIEYEKNLWPIVETKELLPGQFDELATLFEQPFYFLGSGNQTFAFVSADEQYVLKFFKFQHLKDNRLCFKSEESCKKRIQQVFLGHSLAYVKNADNSGILYAHLNPKEFLPFSVTVYDKKNSKYTIPLNDVVFVVQKKGESANKVIGHLLEKGELELAKLHIRDLLAMYLSEYNRGLFDRDHNVMHNLGFCDGRPLHIDVGKLRSDENMKDPTYYLQDLQKVAWERIDKWIKRYHSKYRDEIAMELCDILYEIELLQKT